MFFQRAIVTFTLGPLAVYLIYLGGWAYFIPVAAILIIGVVEYVQITQRLGWRSPLWLMLPAVLAQWLLPERVQQELFGSHIFGAGLAAPALLLSFLAAMGYGLWRYERRPAEKALSDWLASSVGVFYLGWLGSHFFRLRGIEQMAWQWTALAIVGTWVADSGAYVVGKGWGRRRLSPRLSPNKTAEGYIGGIVFGTITTLLIASFFQLPFVASLALGLLVSVVSPAGDLGMSLFKREAGLKDSGRFLPGHGGALDRIDSLIWSVALAYYLALLVLGLPADL